MVFFNLEEDLTNALGSSIIKTALEAIPLLRSIDWVELQILIVGQDIVLIFLLVATVAKISQPFLTCQWQFGPSGCTSANLKALSPSMLGHTGNEKQEI